MSKNTRWLWRLNHALLGALRTTTTALLILLVPLALLASIAVLGIPSTSSADSGQRSEYAATQRGGQEGQAARDTWVNPVDLRPCVPFLRVTIPKAPNGVCDDQLEYPGDQCWDQAAWDALVGRERVARVSLGSITYFDFGNRAGETLILMPGMGSTKTQWDPAFLRDLAGTFRLIIFDYPGIGTANIHDYADFTVENLAAAMWEFITVRKIVRPHLLGFAFSGKVAGLMFLEHGAALGKYVNVAGRIYNASGRTVSDELLEDLTSLDMLLVVLAAWPDNACGRANLIAVAERGISHTQEVRTAEAMAASRQAQKLWQQAGDTLDLRGLLNDTLILAGDIDDISPLEDMSTAAAVLAATRFNLWPSRTHPDFRHYPWASHTVIYQYRPWVVREITWFLLGKTD